MSEAKQPIDGSMTKFLSKRRCLVTGGAGFIGSHLCRRLVRAGASVVVFDFVPRSDRSLLAALGLTGQVEYLQGDIRSPHDLKKLAGRPFDFVFHLAAQPISGLSNLEPQTTIEVNAGGTKALCAMLSRSCDAAVVLASSACAYGIPTAGASPLTETTPLRAGFYAYTESKQKAEQEFRNAKGMRGVIGRFVNVYGPGDRHFSRIIPRTIRQLFGNLALSLSRGDGSTVLDFLYVDEAVDAFLRLAKYASTQKDSTPQVFNFGIGSRNATSIRDLVLKISEIYDGKSRDVVPQAPTIEPPTVKFLDSAKARAVLSWSPQVFLDAGLRTTIDWYHNHIDDLTHLEDADYPPLIHGELLTEMTLSSPDSDTTLPEIVVDDADRLGSVAGRGLSLRSM